MDDARPTRASVLREALSPADLKRLSVLSAPRAAASVLGTWALVAGILVVAVRVPHPLVWVGAAIALAAQQHALAILAHDAAHHRLFENRRVNEVVGRLCAYMVGMSLVAYRQQHTMHHQHLYTERDPDMALMAGYPRGRAYLLRKLAQDLVGLTTLKNLRYLYGPMRPGGASGRPDAARSERKRDQLGVALFILGVLALAAATHQWLALALWVVPELTIYQVFLRLRALFEHGAPADTHSPLQAARTNLPGPLARWLLFPHHVHYHIEHHLYPSIPHYRLPEAHRLMRASGVLEGAEVCATGSAWKKIFAERVGQGP